MHYLVKLLVEADSKEEALECAERDGDQLVEMGEFDYHSLSGRWGESKPYRVTSKKGKELIKEGMEASRRDFDRGLEAVKYMLENFTEEQIYEEDFGNQKDAEFYLSRYQFHVVSGDTNCPCIFAMDGNLWGGKVNKKSDIEYILKKDQDVTGRKLWVVGVDFHN